MSKDPPFHLIMNPVKHIFVLTIFLLLIIQINATTNNCGCKWESSSCVQDFENCENGNVCPCEGRSSTTCSTYSAGILYCVEPSGRGDPLFTAFDGKSFYFHGEHEKKYVLHATTSGDILVAKMRATQEQWMGINRTYFEQFGIRLAGSSDRYRFFLKRNDTDNLWKVFAEVNGISFRNAWNVPSDIHFQASSNKFIVRSPFTKFTVKGVSLNSIYRRHLDFSVKISSIRAEHRFTGVLGRTVNKNIPYRIGKLNTDDEKKIFESKMRELFNVPNLFPSVDNLKKAHFVIPEVSVV